MGAPRTPNPNQLRRLVEELAEAGLVLDGSAPWHEIAVVELDYALRPTVHERRVPSYGAIIEPTTEPTAWSARTELAIDRRAVDTTPVENARRYADGIVSWLLRRVAGPDEWAVFDRPAGSERDLVVLAAAFGAVVVQRHPSGHVRMVGDFGVYRWDGLGWHHEPLVSAWLDAVSACVEHGDREVLETLLEFAVHDLGARGIGATLVYRPDPSLPTSFEDRLPAPPPLRIRRAADLAPLRHALAQVDGATLFDDDGTLRRIGVRLVPTPEAETVVDGFRGMRHTAGRRYSYDDPSATVIVVSEDGPVTVLRGGALLGASATTDDQGDEPDD
ncbi:MAG: hypothetical protein JWM47_3167 [Acidimicrobiales bacterium]|nr:hypothetical protein [Acidimicrobiales bacterium]